MVGFALPLELRAVQQVGDVERAVIGQAELP